MDDRAHSSCTREPIDHPLWQARPIGDAADRDGIAAFRGTRLTGVGLGVEVDYDSGPLIAPQLSLRLLTVAENS